MTQQQPLTSLDVLGSDVCRLLPLPPSFVAAPHTPTAASSSSSSTDRPQSASAASPAPITADLIWTICSNGSWAIPLKRGIGKTLAGHQVVWLSKVKGQGLVQQQEEDDEEEEEGLVGQQKQQQQEGFVPQLEEGLGHVVPLPGTSGKAMTLQKAVVSNHVWGLLECLGGGVFCECLWRSGFV